jgi:NADPH:quinone reductase-like Zn-dependent oxidoreductase
MKAISIAKPGSFDRLRLVERPDPKPAPGEVLVETRAVGVNFADVVVRLGLYPSAKKYVGWPITPGFELSGEVAALGEGVEDLSLGERVFGVSRFGAYASHVCVPRGQLFRVPAALSHAQAATFPTVFLTAYYALREIFRVRPGGIVLVHSAAGGVGLAALQLARADGLVSVGIVGAAHKRQVALDYGAHHVIDKSTQALWPELERIAPAGVQLVLESNGAETLRQSYAHLAPTGRLVVYGFHSMLSRGRGRPNWLKLAYDFLRTPRFHPLEMVDSNKGLVAFNLSYLFDQRGLLTEAMGRMLGELESGVLRPLPVSELPLADAAGAHRALQSGTTVGKLALIP